MGDVMDIAKTTIAILGGTGLALRWAHAGARVLIGSHDPEKAEATVATLKETLPSARFEGMVNADAVCAADLAVMTVNASAHAAALEGLKGCLEGKVLVDATARVGWRDPKPAPLRRPAGPRSPRRWRTRGGRPAKRAGACPAQGPRSPDGL
jgi:predicted dinucleotide-binding enzyme